MDSSRTATLGSFRERFFSPSRSSFFSFFRYTTATATMLSRVFRDHLILKIKPPDTYTHVKSRLQGPTTSTRGTTGTDSPPLTSTTSLI